MKTITLPKEKMHIGNLILVNADYSLQSIDKKELIPVRAEFSKVLMKREASNMLQLIFEKIRCFDNIVPVSGYRCAREQAAIYDTSLVDNGEDFTQKFVAKPFHSEHQTGLAIDLGEKKDVIDFIRPEFPYNGICNEFRKVAPYYGFIERYPKDKEQVTGISHEPWHFRYVGYPHSEIISKNGITLEEYIDFIKDFLFDSKYLVKQNNGKKIEVFYVPVNSLEMTEVLLPEKSVYQVSGNNLDGFIVTLWRNSHE